MHNIYSMSPVAALSAHLFLLSLSSMHPSMQLAVRGGITVEGNFAYHIEPECCIKLNITCEQEGEGSDDLELEGEGSGDLELVDEGSDDLEWCEEWSGDLYTANSTNGPCTKVWVDVTYCTAVYGSWPDSYVELYAYYQTRRFKSKWPVSLYTCVCIYREQSRDRNHGGIE